MTQKVLLSWSSGKDSAWSLYHLQQTPGIEVVGLFSSINQSVGRVAMHATRTLLVQQQAAQAGLPVEFIPLPKPCTNVQYETIMTDFYRRTLKQGIHTIAYGDLFLEDIRQYREMTLTKANIKALFPLWGQDTQKLSVKMLASGLRAQLTCIDPKQMPKHFAGAEFNHDFLNKLPETVDPCGENGEFHTFTYAGPMFKQPIPIEVGKTIERDGFIFTDLQPSAP